MVKLNGYDHFVGRHWETGSVANFYAFRGVNAPHTGRLYSEALLLGVSGGIVFGYFSFAYQGYDPHVAILTRNTFDPLDTLLERLGVEQEVRQTNSPEKGLKNLLDTLESGLPAITWVDLFSLPYFELPNTDNMYLMCPVVVYGYDEAEDAVWIADRSKAPLRVTPAQLVAARGRVKLDKFRVLTPGSPDEKKLAAAVSRGIWDTIQLFTEQPPKGSWQNFGFAAYQHWAELLVNPKARNSWARVFPPGRPMLAGLSTAFLSIIQNGEGNDAERKMFADFLDEAATILNRPALMEAAACFRDAAGAWETLGERLLPDEIEPFGRMRRLMLERKRLFLDQGGAARGEIDKINAEIGGLKTGAETSFPLEGTALEDFLQGLRAEVLKIHDVEQEAVRQLQAAIV